MLADVQRPAFCVEAVGTGHAAAHALLGTLYTIALHHRGADVLVLHADAVAQRLVGKLAYAPAVRIRWVGPGREPQTAAGDSPEPEAFRLHAGTYLLAPIRPGSDDPVCLHVRAWSPPELDVLHRAVRPDPRHKRLVRRGRTLRAASTQWDRPELLAGNRALASLLERAQMAEILLIAERVVRRRWTVVLPRTPAAAEHGFRELARMWSDAFPAEVVIETATDTQHCWLGTRRSILLADDVIASPSDEMEARRPIVLGAGRRPWIAWARRPLALETVASRAPRAPQIPAAPLVAPEPRRGASGAGELLAAAKACYGICTRLDRAVELMALGTVPVIPAGHELSSNRLYEPLREGEHYLCRAPEAWQEERATSGASGDAGHGAASGAGPHAPRWEAMSCACRAWYARNASPRGSLRRTLGAVLGQPLDETESALTPPPAGQ